MPATATTTGSTCPRCHRGLTPGGPCGPFQPSPRHAPQIHLEGLPTRRCEHCGTTDLAPPLARMAGRAAEQLGVALSTAATLAAANEPSQQALLQQLQAAPVRVAFGAPPPAAAVDDGGGLVRIVRPEEIAEDLDDLFVSDEVRAALLAFVARVERRTELRAALGPRLGPKLDRSILALTGRPGVGKNVVALVLARRLRRPLLTIDLAELEGAKVGQTEKNVKRIFKLAAQLDGIIFGDELDILLGARLDATSEHGTYINAIRDAFLIELNAFRGVAVMASNLARQFDPAVARRMVRLELPPPDATVLQRALQSHLAAVALEQPADPRWVKALATRTMQHERTRGNPARPFTIAELEEALSMAATRAAERCASGPITLSRADVEAGLADHLQTLAVEVDRPTPAQVRAEVAAEVGVLLARAGADHRRRSAAAARGRPSAQAAEATYRPAAEATLADLADGYTQLGGLVGCAGEVLAAREPGEQLRRLRRLQLDMQAGAKGPNHRRAQHRRRNAKR